MFASVPRRTSAALIVLLIRPSLHAEESPVKISPGLPEASRLVERPLSAQNETPTVVHLPMQRLPIGTRLGSARVGEPATSNAQSLGELPGDRLVYSNTLGRVAVDFGANRLISDDVTITSTGRNAGEVTCRLTRMRFEVDGRVSEAPAEPSGPYTVTWALYSTCPYALTAGIQRNSRIIPGSAGILQINDDSPTWIEVEFPAETPVYAWTNMWFGVQFSRDNAGLVSGAPAQVGHSMDIFDFPGSACQANLGGFPTAPHGSFNLEIWGDTESCPQAYVAYKNLRESGSGINDGSDQPGAWLTDDITLQNACIAIGFTVGVKGPGAYQFELRSNCGAPIPIGGFSAAFINGQSSGQEPRIYEFLFPNPINISRTFSYAMNVSSPGGGAIVTGAQASIGHTLDMLEIAPQCVPEDLAVGMDALHFSLICHGPPPLGACCDMFIPTCDGGMLDGDLCDATADCQPTCSGGFCAIHGSIIEPAVACTNGSECQGGTCDSTCKEVPQTNCPFPPRFTSSFDVSWEEGKTCASDSDEDGAFPGLICGQGVCCTIDGDCLTLTESECLTIPREGPFPTWYPGRNCDAASYLCEVGDCLPSGPCEIPHSSPGCTDNRCCIEVCYEDDFCCTNEWDEICVGLASTLCACDALIPFDTDSDDDVDLKDFAFFQNCFEGDPWPDQCCRMVDHALPGELVDQSDYAQFKSSLSGPL